MPSPALVETGPFFARRRVRAFLPEAARLVEQHLGERIPARTEVRLASPSDFGRAVLEATGGNPSWWKAASVWNEFRRNAAGDGLGLTLATHDARVLVLIHLDAARDPDTLDPVAVHELTHAVQFGRPGVAAQCLAFQRHELGLERQSRRWLKDYLADVEKREAEAYRVQEHLTHAL